jgi:hypothetical protein
MIVVLVPIVVLILVTLVRIPVLVLLLRISNLKEKCASFLSGLIVAGIK